MNDLEWLSSNDAPAMLQFIAEYHGLAPITRRLRLVAAGCCRVVWDCLRDSASRRAVEAVERLASDSMQISRLLSYRNAAHAVWSFPLRDYYWDWEEFYRLVEAYGEELPRVHGGFRRALRGLPSMETIAAQAATLCANPDDARLAAFDTARVLNPIVTTPLLADIVRDVFGNPFAPPVIELAWRSKTVVDLARMIESQQAFEMLPILSDALLDAGCDDDAIINHCRQTQRHVRGCWLVDALLLRND